MRASNSLTRRGRLVVAIAVMAIAIPGPAFGAAGSGSAKPSTSSYVTSSAAYVVNNIAGVTFRPLINSGETAFGTLFEGIPDGIGVVPGQDAHKYVDLYVTHEQSPVPFGGFGDYSNSSVSRVRVDLATKSVIDLSVALSPDEGFIRFCSAFMAGPEQGFPHYTFLVNEESNDPLAVPAGAVYGADPAYGGANIRQAGYSAYLDTANGKIGVLSNAGRHNHENQVIVPGGWNGIYSLSGDDTFTFPSTTTRPNLSQIYMFSSKNWKSFQKDEGALWAFRVTGTGGPAIDPANAFNGANDFLDMTLTSDWSGEFIPVPANVAQGTDAGVLPQDALEDWSNAHNVFQFVRIEDIAYDPDNTRVVYFTDTGNTKLTDNGAGRLYRGASGVATNGRIFKMVLNADDPTKVDSFSILADADVLGMRHPDNIAVSNKSVMVQEDIEGDATIWMYSLSAHTWTKIAHATQPKAETSGIIDVSAWFGDGWWALDVQSHANLSELPGQVYTNPVTGATTSYTARRENGQLLLMYVPGS